MSGLISVLSIIASVGQEVWYIQSSSGRVF